MASISMWMGKGMYGTSCDPPQSPSLVEVFGQPFGHAFHQDLMDLLEYCDCYIYDEMTSFNVDSLSCQHEIPFCYHRLYPNDKLHNYRLNCVWKKGSTTIFSTYYDFFWDPDSQSPPPTYYHGFVYIGWTPCWWWAGGSEYNGYEEITEGLDTGTNYRLELELYDVTSGQSETTNYIDFSVNHLHHTVMYWDHIQNFTGAEVGGDFGMKTTKWVYDEGTGTWITAWYRQKNLDHNASITVDGFDGLVNLQAFRSGYVRKSINCAGVVDKNSGNGPYDFTGTNYLAATVEGIVLDDDSNPIENANVFTQYFTEVYGAKTNGAGKYALPIHLGATWTIKAIKNNHIVNTHASTVAQTGYHPTSAAAKNFTLSRMTDRPVGVYAHLDSLAVDNQSAIIPDDPVTGAGTLLHPNSVIATIVKAKTQKWGSGAAQSTTSTGTSNGGKGFGVGDFDYDGGMGDAESWPDEE